MRNKKRAVLFSLLALAFLSAIFLGGAAVGAIYRGELADAWRTLRYERHVKLEHGNLLSDGAEGFVRDLDRSNTYTPICRGPTKRAGCASIM